MKNYHSNLSKFCILVLACLTGCISEIEIFKGLDPNFVIDGVITTDPGPQRITIGFSKRYGEFGNHKLVEHATVKVIDNLGNEEVFKHVKFGVFLSDDSFSGVVGRSYRVHVILESGRQYASLPDTIFSAPQIEAIRYIQNDEGSVSTLNFYHDFTDGSDAKNFYRWRFKNTFEFLAPLAYEASKTYQKMKSSVCLSLDRPILSNEIYLCWVTVFDNEYLQIESDEFFNGRALTNFKTFSLPLDRRFDRGYYVQFEQHSLSCDAYNYWKSIRTQMGNSGTIFETNNYQIRGNVYAVDDENELVLGFFGASDVSTKTVFIGEYIGRWGNICCSSQCYERCPTDRCLDCRRYSGTSSNIKPPFWPH